jgi:Divergent InlB B-repeat domain
MKPSCIGIALCALLAVGAALSLPSCGHDQKLVSLEIQPGAFTFLEPYPTGTEQYTAIGTYIHPPATMDVTNQATWKIDDGVVTMATSGLFTPAAGYCGGGNISASVPEGTGGASNVVIGYATVTVDNPTQVNCPGYGTEVELSVQVSGHGTVTSTTGNINCPPACIAPFAVGASVGLTAEPQSGYVVTWSSACTSSSGNNCSVTIPTGGANVLATFQPQ